MSRMNMKSARSMIQDIVEEIILSQGETKDQENFRYVVTTNMKTKDTNTQTG